MASSECEGVVPSPLQSGKARRMFADVGGGRGSKVLVANRGEIAVRINQTLRVMGIAPVAVYSESDAGAPHVTTAEQSVALPGNTAEETYLSIPKMVEAALDCGVDALHPGYGFLKLALGGGSGLKTLLCRRTRRLPGPAGKWG